MLHLTNQVPNNGLILKVGLCREQTIGREIRHWSSQIGLTSHRCLRLLTGLYNHHTVTSTGNTWILEFNGMLLNSNSSKKTLQRSEFSLIVYKQEISIVECIIFQHQAYMMNCLILFYNIFIKLTLWYSNFVNQIFCCQQTENIDHCLPLLIKRKKQYLLWRHRNACPWDSAPDGWRQPSQEKQKE